MVIFTKNLYTNYGITLKAIIYTQFISIKPTTNRVKYTKKNESTQK